MTATETAEEPTSLDFDNADTVGIEEGIKEAGHALANKYVVKYPDLWVRTVSGSTYRLPLAVPGNYFDDLKDLDDGRSPLDQAVELLKHENPDKDEQIEAELSVSLLSIADKYADVIEKVQMASMGKFKPSGDKSNRSEQK